MATYGSEDLPGSWDDDRDTAFFRITGPLFSSAFTFGASVLLASYDEACEPPAPIVDLPNTWPSSSVTRVGRGVAG